MSDNKSSGGIGVCGLLGVAFIILKLCKVIDWSWWWVTAPFWGGIALVLVVLVIIGLVALYGAVTLEKKKPAKSKWTERLEEIQAQQRAIKERRNGR